MRQTRLEPLVSFLFYFTFHITLLYFLGSVMAPTAAEARDATRLEPLVCYIYIYIYIVLIFLGPLNASTPGLDAGSE